MAPDVSPEGHIRRYLTSVSPYRDKLARAGAQRFDQGLHDEPLGHAGHHRFSSLTRSARESRSDNVQDLTWAADFIKEGAVLAGPIKRAAKVGKPNDDWKDYEGMDPDTADSKYSPPGCCECHRRIRAICTESKATRTQGDATRKVTVIVQVAFPASSDNRGGASPQSS